MNYKIRSREEARRFSHKKHDFKSAIISISDVGSTPNSFSRISINGIVSVLKLEFDDVGQGDPNCIQQEDVDKIVQFVRYTQNKVDTIIVQCECGISRSAGICAAIAHHIDGNAVWIFSDAKYRPNMCCYEAVLHGLVFSNNNAIDDDEWYHAKFQMP